MTQPASDELIAVIESGLEGVTPGPWYAGCFSDEDSECNCRYILSDGYSGSIATISVDNGLHVGEGGNDSPPEEEAN